MQIDLELYRKGVRISANPLVRLSVIDIAPEHPQRTMVFLHGFGGQALQWKHQLREFSFSSRVIALDQRGHGRSDKPRGSYFMDQLVADLQSTLEILGIAGKFVLIGHSFGGAIAAEYAACYPERLDRLVLVASAGEYKLNPLYRLALRLPAPLLQILTPFARGKLGAPPHVLKAWYANTLSRWNGWSLFRSLAIPTLVIRGHFDLVLGKPHFEEVARAIPGAEEVDVGASGHMVMLERRAAINRAIHGFLEETRQSWRARELQVESARESLVQSRPWLSHYEDGVPYTVAVPRVPLQELLRSAVRRFPLRTALYFEGSRITYRRLNQEANRFANALLSLGLEKGDRVMLLLPNLPQLVIAFFGTLKAGGVAVFTLPLAEPSELLRQVHASSPRVLVTLTKFYDLAVQALNQAAPASPGEQPASTSLQHVIFTHPADYLPVVKKLAFQFDSQKREQHRLPGPLAGGMHRFVPLLYAQPRQSPEVEVLAEDLAVIHFTGGTTAEPKGVMLSHRNLVANALQTRHWLPQAHEGHERFLCVLPFSHSYGLTTTLVVPVSLGATLILKATFNVEDVLKTIKRLQPTIFPGAPNIYVAINNFPGVRKYGVRSIKACLSGSAPLPVEVQEAFEKLTRGRLVEGYGLTEASPVTHANPLNGLRKVGSIGLPLPSTEARLVDLARGKKVVPTGQIGELAVRGPQVMMGYWQNPADTASVMTRDGWLLTGDVAQVDSDGYFRIVARKAEMWYPEKPGKPAFPRDIEEVLFEIPQVKEAAVVAIAGQPIAFVIPKVTHRSEKPSSESLIAYCRRRLPPELVPRLVVFVEDFPRSFIGKVLRRELARRYETNNQPERK